MTSPTQWAWVWVNFGNWWWTGRPGVLQSMESKRVGHDWATKLNWSWGWSFNTLAIWCKEPTLEKTLMLGKIEGKRGKKKQRMRWLDSITESTDMNLRKIWEIVEDRGAWCATVHGVTKNWTQLSEWTTTCHGQSGNHAANFFHRVGFLISTKLLKAYGLEYYL